MTEGPDPTGPLCCPPLAEEPLDADTAAGLATVIGALADPVRLRIFSIIASQGETCSCNLEGPIGRSQPTISHHTSKLAAAGLIAGERRGRWMWWGLFARRETFLRGTASLRRWNRATWLRCSTPGLTAWRRARTTTRGRARLRC